MARKMNVSSALNINNEDALRAVKELINSLTELHNTVSDPLSIKVELNTQSVRDLKSELKSALQQVQSSNGGISGRSSEIQRVGQQSQRMSRQVESDVRRSVTYLQSLGVKSAQAMNSAISSSIGGADRLVAKAKATQKSIEETFSHYRGGASGFMSDIGSIDRGGINSSNLPAIKDFSEVFSYGKKSIEDYGNVLEGDVIDEFANLRDVASGSFGVVDGEVEKSTHSLKSLGSNVRSVGKDIQATGRALTKLGDGLTQTSTRGMMTIRSVGETALRSLTILGVNTSTIIGDAVTEIKNLEQARVGLTNQFSYKEVGFDIDAYIEQIKSEARKTVGVSAGSLADYIKQIAPAASNSEQAFQATMGLLKSIAFSGGDTSQELGYVVRNIRDVLAKGRAYQMDINQFNRAIPGLPTILQQAGLTQYVSQGQLTISEENVGQLLDVFAQLNKEGSPVANILEEMNQTLGGLLEESEETIRQTIVTAIDESGLLQVWKDLLRNDQIKTFTDEVARGLTGGLASFLSSFDMNMTMSEFFDVLRDVTQYGKNTLLPALKNALGLTEDADLTEVIIKLIQLFGEFSKGMIDGIKWTLDVIATLREFNNWLRSIGVNVEDLARVFGWIMTAGWGLGKIITSFGVSMTNLGRIVDYVGRKLRALDTHTISSGGTLPSRGSFGDRIAGSLSSITGKSISTSTLLSSLGILAGGHALSDHISSAIGGNNSTAKGIIKDVTDLGSTFLAFNKILTPAGALFVTFLEGLGKVSNAMKSIDQTRREGRAATAAQSLDTLQNVYVNNLKDSLRSAGLFQYEDPDSEDALVAVMEEALNIKSSDNPQEVLNRLLGVYMQRYSANATQTKFVDYLSAITDPSNQQYIMGSTRLTAAYAQTAEGEQALRDTYNRLLELRMVSASADIANYSGEELLRYFQGHGYKFESVEQLNAIRAYAESSRAGQQSILDQSSKVNFEVNGVQLQQDVEKYMSELGMYQLPDGGWGIKSEFQLQVNEEVNTQIRKDLFDSLGIKEIEPGRAVLEVGVMPTVYDSQNSSARRNATLYKALTGEDLPAPIRREAAGGYITPIYRAVGGNVPAMGVDVVPAMLAQGEFVQPSHAVDLAGLSTMEALRRGDLAAAYNFIGSRINRGARNYTTTNSIRRNSQSNTIIVNYPNMAARKGAYRSIANMMAMR